MFSTNYILFYFDLKIEAMYRNPIHLQAKMIEEVRQDEELRIPRNIDYAS